MAWAEMLLADLLYKRLDCRFLSIAQRMQVFMGKDGVNERIEFLFCGCKLFHCIEYGYIHVDVIAAFYEIRANMIRNFC